MSLPTTKPDVPDLKQPRARQLLIGLMISALLVATALLKAASPSDAVSIASAYGLSYSEIVLVVQLELLVAAHLASGWKPRLACSEALLLFSIFAGFSLVLAVSGHKNCGCFGAIKVNPWFTFALDVFVLAAMTSSIAPTAPNCTSRLPLRLFLAAIGYLLLGGGALTFMLANRPHALAAGHAFGSSNGLVILEPEEWVGEAFPLGPHFDPAIELDSGKFIVVLHHHDCHECQAALPQYETLAATLQKKYQEEPVVLVEVPPYGPYPSEGIAFSTRLSDKIEWFVQAPVEIQITDGIVTAASRELPSISSIDEAISHGPRP